MSSQDKESQAPIGANAGYAVFQLARALRAADKGSQDKTREKIENWQRVLEHFLRGTAQYGSRTPFADVPAWVTLKVLTGGIATGQYLAGGELTGHERRLVDSLPDIRPGFERLDLNAWHLTDDGMASLQQRLLDGDYRIDVPEEAALLTVAWLAGQERRAEARQLVDVIAPFFGQLRFFPGPSTGQALTPEQVHLFTVADVRARLSDLPVQKHVAVQKQVVTRRLPLFDAAISLFHSTYRDDWPCQLYPDGWAARAHALCTQFEADCGSDSLSRTTSKDRVGELFTLLRQCALEPASLNGRQVGRVRRIVNDFVASHGLPDSESHLQQRARQARDVAAPEHHLIGRAVSERLQDYPDNDGIADFSPLLRPLTHAEAEVVAVPAGTCVPESISRRLECCRKGTIAQLIAEGVIRSADTVAQVLPAITAETVNSDFRDPALRTLSIATYRAFRQRRSLLLLNLQRQVRLHELPWVAAVKGFRKVQATSQKGARRVLAETCAMTISAFPQAIIPNKLLQEFRALAATAKLDAQFVEEVAADIFMGRFSSKYTEVARRSAHLMAGSLYARYYDIDTDRLASLKGKPSGSSDALAQCCRERANVPESEWHPAANGMIIEQQQVLTTQNLAVAFDALDLKARLDEQLAALALACFQWICERQQIKTSLYHAQLIMLKNTAYAWRQMMFYLSTLDESRLREAIASIEVHFANQPAPFRERFLPAMIGLRAAVAGESLTKEIQSRTGAKIFYGWTVDRHWLMAA